MTTTLSIASRRMCITVLVKTNSLAIPSAIIVSYKASSCTAFRLKQTNPWYSHWYNHCCKYRSGVDSFLFWFWCLLLVRKRHITDNFSWLFQWPTAIGFVGFWNFSSDNDIAGLVSDCGYLFDDGLARNEWPLNVPISRRVAVWCCDCLIWAKKDITVVTKTVPIIQLNCTQHGESIPGVWSILQQPWSENCPYRMGKPHFNLKLAVPTLLTNNITWNKKTVLVWYRNYKNRRDFNLILKKWASFSIGDTLLWL